VRPWSARRSSARVAAAVIGTRDRVCGPDGPVSRSAPDAGTRRAWCWRALSAAIATPSPAPYLPERGCRRSDSAAMASRIDAPDGKPEGLMRPRTTARTVDPTTMLPLLASSRPTHEKYISGSAQTAAAGRLHSLGMKLEIKPTEGSQNPVDRVPLHHVSLCAGLSLSRSCRAARASSRKLSTGTSAQARFIHHKDEITHSPSTCCRLNECSLARARQFGHYCSVVARCQHNRPRRIVESYYGLLQTRLRRVLRPTLLRVKRSNGLEGGVE